MQEDLGRKGRYREGNWFFMFEKLSSTKQGVHPLRRQKRADIEAQSLGRRSTSIGDEIYQGQNIYIRNLNVFGLFGCNSGMEVLTWVVGITSAKDKLTHADVTIPQFSHVPLKWEISKLGEKDSLPC